MELKSNPGRRLSPSKGADQLAPGLTGGWCGAFPVQVGNSSPQSSVVSKHFCFKAESPGRGGAELVTASTKNGAGGEISENPSF